MACEVGSVVDRHNPWRREGDSNPRSREAQRFSRPSQSSALPSLRRAAYRRRSAASGPPVASGPEERWPSQVEGAPLLREYGPKSSSWVRIPPSPPAARYWADHPRWLRSPTVGPVPGDSYTRIAALVAQLDRASDYGSEGWGFESLRARHPHKPRRESRRGLLPYGARCPGVVGATPT